LATALAPFEIRRLIAVNALSRQVCKQASAPVRKEDAIMFKTNVGSLDRGLRIIAGLVLIALDFVGPKTPFGWLGIVPLATGLLSTCPLYSLLGVNTCPNK
jgi:hypothetical protein